MLSPKDWNLPGFRLVSEANSKEKGPDYFGVTNKRYHRRTHKFGIELPKTVKEALEIDARTRTTYWRDALELKMKNVCVAFDILKDEDEIPPGYQ
jgi:hypothetical protein